MTRHPLPAFGPYTIEPGMVKILEDLISTRRPRHILELGCGLSTVVMVYALEQNGTGTLDALEHDAQYVEQARADLKRHELNHLATIWHAPIRNVVVEWDGMAYPWYDVKALQDTPQFDFVLIDGPPGHLSHMSRWPAYHVLRSHLAPDVTMVVDDAGRRAEKFMVEHWCRSDRHLFRSDLNTGRGAVLLERNPNAEN